MSDNIFSLAKYLAAKKEHESWTEAEPEDGDLFLLDEGFDLLASYRSIADREIRLRVKSLIDLIAKRPDISSLLLPAPPPTLTSVDDQSNAPVSASPAAPRRRQAILLKGKAVAAFIAMLVTASLLLEIADPASTDVVAALVSCAPASSPQP